jgi:hypothetical protein
MRNEKIRANGRPVRRRTATALTTAMQNADIAEDGNRGAANTGDRGGILEEVEAVS